jgi:patatin-like phospholipase
LVQRDAGIRLTVYHSTGGLIAIEIGEKGWTLQKCKSKFKKIASEAFTPRVFHRVPLLRRLHSSIYKTQPLYRALREALGTKSFFGGIRVNSSRNKSKVAVTATIQEGKRTVLIANYNRSSKKENDGDGRRVPVYRFLRPGDPAQEFATWEAAAAASATPPYFKAYFHTSSHQYFLDSSSSTNNPAKVAQQECEFLWPDVADQAPDIFLSIGTSQCQKDIEWQMGKGRSGRL